MKIKLNRLVKVAILVLFGLYPLIWFIGKGNALINGLDTNFPLDPGVWFIRRFYIWNGILNGGLHFSSSVAGLFFHFLQVIPYWLGASLQTVEILCILFWSLAIVMSGFIFSRTFITKRFILQLLFVILYSCNIYLFNTWENIKVANLSLMVGLPLLLSLLRQHIDKKRTVAFTLFSSAVLGLVSAGTGINPAYFLCLLLGGVLYVLLLLIVIPSRIETIKASAVVFIPFILVNSFWIIPLIDFLFITSTVQQLEAIGFTNWVASLSANTSLLNVLRLQGAWDWYVRNDYGIPLYIPYALRYFYSTPFIIFSFATPVLAICSFVFRKSKHVEQMLYFSILAVLGIFFGAGTHEPTGTLFIFLLKNLPFFSFFRSPWYIFTPFTIIGLGGLAVIFLDELYLRFSNARIVRNVTGNLMLTLIVGVFICGQLLYSYPLITGKIFRPGRDDSFYQYFPQYVFDAKSYLSTADYSRIVTYPDEQLESFKWGYKGTESILSLFSDVEVVAPSFNYPNQNLAALIQSFYRHIKRGEFESAFRMAHTLGVDSMFIKSDTITLSPDIVDDVAEFTTNNKTIGQWHFMNIADEFVSKKFSIPQYVYALDISPHRLSEVSKLVSPQSIIIERTDSQLKNLPELITSLAQVKEATLVPTTQSEIVSFTYTSSTEPYSLYFTNYNLPLNDLNIVVDGLRVAQSNLELKNNTVIIGPLEGSGGSHTITINLPKPQTETLINSDEVDIIGTPITATKLVLPMPNFSPYKKYKISYQHKYAYGNQPVFQFIQYGPASSYQVESIELIKTYDWLDSGFVFHPVELPSKLEVIINQPIQETVVSKATFRNLEITEVYENKLYIIQEAKTLYSEVPKITFHKISPVKYEVLVENAPNGYFLSMSEGYHKGWQISSQDYIGGKPVHMTGNGYSNLWYIPVGGEKQSITVSFLGQQFYLIGSLVTLSVLVITSSLFIYVAKRRV